MANLATLHWLWAAAVCSPMKRNFCILQSFKLYQWNCLLLFFPFQPSANVPFHMFPYKSVNHVLLRINQSNKHFHLFINQSDKHLYQQTLSSTNTFHSMPNHLALLCQYSTLSTFIYGLSLSTRFRFRTCSQTFSGHFSVERIEGFCDPNPVQHFQCVIQSYSNPVTLSKYLTNPVYIRKKTLIKHSTAVINEGWTSISDPVEIFSKSSPILIRFWIAESGWMVIREPDHVQHCRPWHAPGLCGSSLLKKKNSTRLGQFRENTG